MKRIVPLILLATGAFAQTATQIEKDIRTLAAPRMEGRGLDTNGIKLAADYIESRLRALGLQPAFGKSYRQPFPVKIGVAAGKGNPLHGGAADHWKPPRIFSSRQVFREGGVLRLRSNAPPPRHD